MKSFFWVTLSVLIAVCLINTVVCQPDAVPADTPSAENIPAPEDTPDAANQPVEYRITLRTYNDSDCEHLYATYYVENDITLCQHMRGSRYFKGHCVNGTLNSLIFFDALCQDTAVPVNRPGCTSIYLDDSPNTFGDYTCPLASRPPIVHVNADDPGSSIEILPSVIVSVLLLVAAIMVQ